MASIVYIISNAPHFLEVENKIKKQNRAIVAAEQSGKEKPKWDGPTEKTVKGYKNIAVKFGKWCKATYGCRTLEDCHPHIQDYADYLKSIGRTVNTVHKYLSGICFAFGITQEGIIKEKRTIASTKDYSKIACYKRSDAKRERSPRLYDFANMVGIRRDEYKHLRGNDFVQDEHGNWCVRVRKGKGGKKQLQRIPLAYVKSVANYFDGNGNHYVFTAAEMKNKICLHNLRHCVAWTAYQECVTQLKADLGYREQLTAELKERFLANGAIKKWKYREVSGKYVLRGKNRELAIKAGFPIEYDRLALMATSVYYLSHWRNNVSVANYILQEAKYLYDMSKESCETKF